ncbi:hypothetical protein F0L68_06335 [Solihabitans fulvus]|uniref:Alpha-L-arabinofuranosidase B arabinose-binding domain-containing protein n=1 Tax=Solihabitans fulvus TaxID=1892852 RepID=A0A5B2XNH1_9PSEU|nr:AbfB domain-containing protein [Solihabitans fulvus]KAA2264705.1 hypothetical protein F0L68_06335 [Solihabitans fulvus]
MSQDYWSFQSVNFPDRFIRHRDFKGELTVKDDPGEDFAFALVHGLSGSGYSFQSLNFPDHYLRNLNSRVVLHVLQTDASFAREATFHKVAGLTGAGVSFRADALSDFYLRHRDFQLSVAWDGRRDLAADATFIQQQARWRPYGIIGDRWREMGGEHGPLGWPITAEYDVTDQFGVVLGRRCDFENGQLAYSPNQGQRMVLSVYRRDHTAVFEWGPTDPFGYDFFIVRWSVTGGQPIPPTAQENVTQDSPGRTRTSGFFLTDLPDNAAGSDGKSAGVSFVVEGCDGGPGSSTCRQGWTCPIACRL